MPECGGERRGLWWWGWVQYLPLLCGEELEAVSGAGSSGKGEAALRLVLVAREPGHGKGGNLGVLVVILLWVLR